MIFVNFKTNKEGTGEMAVNLAKICQVVSNKTKIKIIPVVQTVDLWRIKRKVRIPLWVQHADWQPQGEFSGFINLEAIAFSGAAGTLLNHSEHRLSFSTIKKTVKRTKELHLQTMICAQDMKEIINFCQLNPDFLAYEPSELIGSKTKSIAQVYPEIISQGVKKALSIPLIVGAGIHSSSDVKISLAEGVKGILLSSYVVFAKNPMKRLFELAKAF